MRIALVCATERGLLFMQKLMALLPDAEFVIFSFREETWEPPFLDTIRDYATSHGATFIETKQVASPRWAKWWDENPVDLMFAISWRYLIPASIYKRPSFGTFVMHDSLLPRYRGFAPTVWAMLNGEHETGVSLIEMVDEVDAGDMLDQLSVPIGADEPIGDVMKHVTAAYLELLERNLAALVSGTAVRHPQNHALASFTCKRIPDDNKIDWTASTLQIHNHIRATTTPYPGAFTFLNGKRLRIWQAQRIVPEPVYVGRIPGRVVKVIEGVGSHVLTGDGVILVTRVQWDDQEPVVASTVLSSITHTLGF